MLTYLRVKNLKSVADSGRLDLRPLTFLMGPNSSGKSTLLQAILLARQTVDSRDIANPLVIDDDYVKLGSFREFIHNHDTARRLCLEFGLSGEVFRRFPLRPPLSPIESACVTAEFSYNRKTLEIFPTVVEYATQPVPYRVAKRRPSARAHTGLEIELDGDQVAQYRMPSESKFYDIAFPGPYRLPRKAREQRMFLDAVARLPFYLTRAFEQDFGRVFCLGPLRTLPQRTYVAAGETPQDVGLRGESTFAILWAARWKKRPRERPKTAFDRVYQPTNMWLQKFGIAARLELKRTGGSYFIALVTDPALDVPCNFADIGFGASQLLPAIVEVLHAQRGSTVIMEQPEIHLHPGAQATLGDLFVEQAQQGKQLIIETHSEHVVSRVLRRIAEGTLSERDVALYYCAPSAQGTVVQPINVDAFGRFGEGLPAGFFEQGYTESLAHVKAMAERSGAASRGG